LKLKTAKKPIQTFMSLATASFVIPTHGATPHPTEKVHSNSYLTPLKDSSRYGQKARRCAGGFRSSRSNRSRTRQKRKTLSGNC
jgi:hypothetical protein